MHKEYIGDSVYADVDENGYLVLTTNNGHGASNTIRLDGNTLQSLMGYLETYSGLVTA